MFPLPTTTFPASASELAKLLNQSVQQLFSGAPDAFVLREKAYPELSEIRLTLDGATLRPDPPRLPQLTGDLSPALTSEQLHISAARLAVGPVHLNLRLDAQSVRLDQGRDAAGKIALVLRSAAQGRLEIETPISELEEAISALAKREAGKHGVTIENVKLNLRAPSDRSIEAEVQLGARKLFFSTTLRITGRIELDEQLNARLSGLTCQGDGAVGGLASSALAPHLQKLEGRTFPLAALPLGEIRLRAVRLSATDRLALEAEFGAE